jgi:hypothetical protein
MPNPIPLSPSNSEAYRQRLRLQANNILGGKDSITLSKYELIEKICKLGDIASQFRQAAISFEVQLYMVDPNNKTFAGYPQEKLDAMQATIVRWKTEIAEAEKKAENLITSQ